MSQKIYLRLNNNLCEFNNNTFKWRFELPREFTNSKHPDKKINVLNFMYIIRTSVPIVDKHINVEFTSFHSPTLCDGNYNQDNYICTLCYTQNTVYKSYQIKSNPQYIEFYFKDALNRMIESFQYENVDSSGTHYDCEEYFNIDLELWY